MELATNELIQNVVSNYYDYAGSSVTLTVFVNSNVGTTIAIVDSAGTTTSAAHPGDSAKHQMTVTRFLASNISSLKVQLPELKHTQGQERSNTTITLLLCPETPRSIMCRCRSASWVSPMDRMHRLGLSGNIWCPRWAIKRHRRLVIGVI